MNTATTSNPTYQMEHGQQVRLERDKNELVVKVGIAETGIRIPKDGILVLDGKPTGGSKLTIDEKAPFTPRLLINTNLPVKIDGSFIAESGSTQIALVDITPAELTDLKVKKSDEGYKISTSDKHLGQPAKAKGYPEGTKVLQFETRDGKPRTIIVLPGARVDFVNGQNGDQPLFSLDSNEPMETTRMRFKNAQNNAMTEVIDVLNPKNGLAGDSFELAKQRIGLVGDYGAGKVEHKSVGVVDPALTAAIPTSEFVGMQAAPVNQAATDSDIALGKEISRVSDFYLGRAPKIFNGDYGFLGKGEGNKGKLLGKALQEVNAAASDLINEENNGVRHKTLAQLHAKLDEVEQISADIAKQLKNDFVGHGNDKVKTSENYVASYAHLINENFTKLHNQLNESEALRDNRPGAVHTKRDHVSVPSQEGEKFAEVPATDNLLASLARQAMEQGSGHDRLAVADVAEHGLPSVPLAVSAKDNTRAA